MAGSNSILLDFCRLTDHTGVRPLSISVNPDRCLDGFPAGALVRLSMLLCVLVAIVTKSTLTCRHHPFDFYIGKAGQRQVNLMFTMCCLSPKVIAACLILKFALNLITASTRWVLRETFDGVRSLTATQIPRFTRIHKVLLYVCGHLHFECA